MDYILVPALIWLAIISWFDLRTRQIPHTAWAVIPFLFGLAFRIVNGGWAISLLSISVVMASERNDLGRFRYLSNLGSIYPCIPMIGCLGYLAGESNLPATLAILGFWISWELRFWGGADALVSITLILFWPDAPLLISFILANFLVAIVATLISLIRERKLRTHQIPGIPILLLSVIGRTILTGIIR